MARYLSRTDFQPAVVNKMLRNLKSGQDSCLALNGLSSESGLRRLKPIDPELAISVGIRLFDQCGEQNISGGNFRYLSKLTKFSHDERRRQPLLARLGRIIDRDLSRPELRKQCGGLSMLDFPYFDNPGSKERPNGVCRGISSAVLFFKANFVFEKSNQPLTATQIKGITNFDALTDSTGKSLLKLGIKKRGNKFVLPYGSFREMTLKHAESRLEFEDLFTNFYTMTTSKQNKAVRMSSEERENTAEEAELIVSSFRFINNVGRACARITSLDFCGCHTPTPNQMWRKDSPQEYISQWRNTRDKIDSHGPTLLSVTFDGFNELWDGKHTIIACDTDPSTHEILVLDNNMAGEGTPTKISRSNGKVMLSGYGEVQTVRQGAVLSVTPDSMSLESMKNYYSP